MIGGAGVNFTVGLIDKMSGPAKTMSGSVRDMDRELRKARTDLSAYQRQLSLANQLGDVAGHRRYAALVHSQKRSVFELAKDVEGAGGGIGNMASLAGGPWVMAATAAAAAAIGLGVAFEKVGVAALRAANEEQSFIRQTRAAFEGLSGSKAAGDATYDMVDRLSKRLPIARRELVDWTKELQAAGVTDVGVLRRGVSALGASKALSGDEGASTLLNTLRRVQEAIDTNHGLKLADRQLAQLGKTGANVNDVAKEMNVSAQQLQKSLKAGTVDAGKFGNALLSAIEKKGSGPLKAMWGDLDVLERKAGEFAMGFFKDINLEPVTDAFQHLMDLMDQNTNAGQNLGKGIKSGTDLIVKGFARVTNEVTVAILKVQTFALEADTALINVGNRARNTYGYIKSLPGRMAAWAHGDAGAMDFPDLASDKVDAQKAGIDKLEKSLSLIKERRASGIEFETDSAKVSDAIAAGVKNSLIDHAQGVALAGSIMGKKAVEGAAKGAEVHSPSRATYRTGRFIGAGLELGMRSYGGSVGRAGAYLGAQATRTSMFLSAERDRRGAPGSRGGPSSVNIDRAEVNIQAPAGVTDAQEISAWGLAIALERQQLMSGG